MINFEKPSLEEIMDYIKGIDDQDELINVIKDYRNAFGGIISFDTDVRNLENKKAPEELKELMYKKIKKIGSRDPERFAEAIGGLRDFYELEDRFSELIAKEREARDRRIERERGL